jgi:hypothetical protein
LRVNGVPKRRAGWAVRTRPGQSRGSPRHQSLGSLALPEPVRNRAVQPPQVLADLHRSRRCDDDGADGLLPQRKLQRRGREFDLELPADPLDPAPKRQTSRCYKLTGLLICDIRGRRLELLQMPKVRNRIVAEAAAEQAEHCPSCTR